MRQQIIAAISAALLQIAAGAAHSADLQGHCWADLQERIAELEATTARKGNRKVSLTLSGQVSQALLFWDDGLENNVYVIGNRNDQSKFNFTGNAPISTDLSTGFDFTLRLRDTLSDEVDQLGDDAEFGFVLWHANWYVESQRAGRLTVGQASRVTDTAPENDLSETAIAGFAGVQDIGAAFFLRRNDGGFSELVWGDLISHLNGDTANIVRYDTPSLWGLVLSANYGEDDIWDVGAKYEGEGHGFRLAATLAYSRSTDENGIFGLCCEPDNSVIVGSIAVLHEPSGLNALVAAGQQSFDERVEDADGFLRTPADGRYVYSKLGWISKWSHLGPTAFYAEYGHFQDFATAGFDGEEVASLAANGICSMPGNCRVTGNQADIWGLGIVQTIDAAAMQMYVGYRHYQADIDLADATGAKVAAEPLDSFDTVIVGSIILF